MNRFRFVGFRFVGFRPALQRLGIMLLMAAAAPMAVAQNDDGTEPLSSPGLDIEATAGWDDTVDRWTPIPIAILINNNSAAAVEAEVWLTDPWRSLEISLGEVFVSQGASRRLTSVQSLQDWNDCYVELRVNNKPIWRQVLAINTGQEFDRHQKYALIVNNSTRRLDLPPESATPFIKRTHGSQRRYGYFGNSYYDDTRALTETQNVVSLNCKTWQLSTHAAPLMVADAIVFPNDVDTDDINGGQWKALAEYICQGGTVFVHSKSPDIIQQLIESAPLSDEPSFQLGNFATRRIGLGSIKEFRGKLFDEGTADAEQQIVDTIAQLDKHSLPEMIQLSDVYNRESGRADRTRSLIMAFFGIYTLMSGVITLVFFRKNRRTVTIYILSLVAIACVTSVILGSSLRYSRGDVHWVSVTQAGTGGAVQYAKLDLQSAGGRNTEMGVTGPNADLQYIATTRNYYSGNGNESRFPPFTRQPSLSPGDDEFQIKVPITPWGRRQLQATAFVRELAGLDVKLSFNAGKSAVDENSPAEEFTMDVVNPFPFDIVNAQIITCWASSQTTSQTATEVNSNGILVASEVKVTDEVYFSQQLGTIASGQTISELVTIAAEQRTGVMTSAHDGGTLEMPAISRTGVTAWIVGKLPKSPGLAIDEANSDFSSAEELHFFVQQVLPENMSGL